MFHSDNYCLNFPVLFIQIPFIMKKQLSILLVFLLPMLSNAQNLEWLISGGGLKSDKATTIVVDDSGNTYVAGYYNEQAQFGSFDTGFSFASSKEAFVAKIDPMGNYLWVKMGSITTMIVDLVCVWIQLEMYM